MNDAQANQQEMGLFNYNVNLAPMVMDIRSETLEPISSSAKRYVFRLDSAGYLDQNSMLLFKLQNTAGSQTLRANTFGGGLAGISRATLQVGDYILNDTLDIGRVACLTGMGGQNRDTRNKYNGHFYQNQFHTKVLSKEEAGTNSGVAPHADEGSIIYDNIKSGINYGVIDSTANATAGATASVNTCRITNNKDNNYQFGIPLGQILPCLRGRSIPLFLFQDYRILITIEFADPRDYCVDLVNDNAVAFNAGTGANNAFKPLLNSATYQDVKLQVDYVIYPSEIQDQARQQTQAQGGLTLDFFDIIKVEKNITEAVPNTQFQKVEHRIGADNKEVHKIYMLKRLVRAKPYQTDRLLQELRCDGMNQEVYNVNIDGVDYFQEDKFAPSSQYDETSNCLTTDLKVDRPMYFNDENTIFCRQAESFDGLLGKYKPLCVDLSNGMPSILGGGRQIGAYPIIWKYERRPCSAHTCPSAGAGQAGAIAEGGNSGNGSYYIENLSGALEVDYFMMVSRTANIKSSPVGTSVMVSY